MESVLSLVFGSTAAQQLWLQALYPHMSWVPEGWHRICHMYYMTIGVHKVQLFKFMCTVVSGTLSKGFILRYHA